MCSSDLLRFSLSKQADVDVKARTVLAALGLLGAVLTREEGADLRSRCQLVATQEFFWELLSTPGQAPLKYKLDVATAVSIFYQALAEAKATPELPWEDKIPLTPHPDLIELVKRSQELEAHSVAEEAQ